MIKEAPAGRTRCELTLFQRRETPGSSRALRPPRRAITLAADSIGALAVMTARWEERPTWVDETNATKWPRRSAPLNAAAP